MRHYDFIIITNEHVLAKVEDQKWQVFEYRDYYPDKMTRDFIDVFDEPEVFLYAIKSIMKLTGRSLWRRIVAKNHLVLFAIDEQNSELRKRLFEDVFYKANYNPILHIEIEPVAGMVEDKNGCNTPVVVVSVIGNIAQLSFCFEGVIITKQVIKESLRTKFDDFIKTCKNLQDKDLSECIDTTEINRIDYEKIRCVWEEKRNIKIIVASSNDSFDYWVDREIKYDYKVNFTQITDLLKDVLRHS